LHACWVDVSESMQVFGTGDPKKRGPDEIRIRLRCGGQPGPYLLLRQQDSVGPHQFSIRGCRTVVPSRQQAQPPAFGGWPQLDAQNPAEKDRTFFKVLAEVADQQVHSVDDRP